MHTFQYIHVFAYQLYVRIFGAAPYAMSKSVRMTRYVEVVGYIKVLVIRYQLAHVCKFGQNIMKAVDWLHHASYSSFTPRKNFCDISVTDPEDKYNEVI